MIRSFYEEVRIHPNRGGAMGCADSATRLGLCRQIYGARDRLRKRHAFAGIASRRKNNRRLGPFNRTGLVYGCKHSHPF